MATNWNKVWSDIKKVGTPWVKTAYYVANPTAGKIAAAKAVANTKPAKELGNAIKQRYTTTSDFSGGGGGGGRALTDSSSSSTTPTGSSSYSSGSSGGGYSSGGSGGGYSTSTTMEDSLSAMLDAYNQAAETNRSIAKTAYDKAIEAANNEYIRAQGLYDQGVTNANTLLDRAQQTYDQGVNDVTNSYNSTASNLLTSLKRFQDENKQNVKNQQRSYLTNQSALDTARELADRQTRVDTAARGLGGSGLQQLAQLQNLVNQGQDISDLATDNQNAMDTLRTALANANEDYDTKLKEAETTKSTALDKLLTTLSNAKTDNYNTLETLRKALDEAGTAKSQALSNAEKDYNNALMGINSDLASKTADTNWNYANTLASLARSGGGSGSSTAGESVNLQYLEDDFNTTLQNLASADKSTLSKIKNDLGLGEKASINDIANAYYQQSLGYGGNATTKLSNYNNYKNNLSAVLNDFNSKNNTNKTTVKGTSAWNKFLNAISGKK